MIARPDLWLHLGALVTGQTFCPTRWVIPTNWSKLKQQDGASKHKSRNNWIMKWNRRAKDDIKPGTF